MTSIHWIFIATIVERTNGAAIPNQDPTVGWVSDPNGRGTFGLLLSCVLTLGLCVGSTMHLEIPQKNETRLQYWMRNLKWVLLGILIPELVVLSAWRQWLSAKQMSAVMKHILEDQTGQEMEQSKDAKRVYTVNVGLHEWTFVHSLYAVMGGFAFDMDRLPQDENAFIPNRGKLTLTARGVILLAKCGMLPDMSLREINDRSKADGLAKALVCLQAGWMVLQTIGRVWSKQPVTLLEVNTFGHVFCAFIVYLLWWQKPREVREPTIIDGEHMPGLCAYFYMSSRASGEKPRRRIRLDSWRTAELNRYTWYPNKAQELCSDRDQVMDRSESSHNALSAWIASQLVSGHNGVLASPPESNPGSLDGPSYDQYKVKFHYLPILQDIDHKRLLRCSLAAAAIRHFAAISNRFEPQPMIVSSNGKHIVYSKPEIAQPAVSTAPDWPSDLYLLGLKGELIGMAL